MNKLELRNLLIDRSRGTPSGRIVRALSEGGGMSAAQIARLTGLAKSTVSMTLSELRHSGMVVESPGLDTGREASVGRPVASSWPVRQPVTFRRVVGRGRRLMAGRR